MNEFEPIPVLDRGYVNYRHHAGQDVTPVDMARGSFAKRADGYSDKANKGLHRFLIAAQPTPHSMPFRHSFLTVELKAPLMVARQLWRYVVGHDHEMAHDPFFAWSEASRRYVTLSTEFYVPTSWREAPENKKQGSGADIADEIVQSSLTGQLRSHQYQSVLLFEDALAAGVCIEQARGFLPSDFQYVTWCWSGSMQGMLFMLTERLDAHAQWETRQYAEAIAQIMRGLWPDTVRRWVDAPHCDCCGQRMKGQA